MTVNAPEARKYFLNICTANGGKPAAVRLGLYALSYLGFKYFAGNTRLTVTRFPAVDAHRYMLCLAVVEGTRLYFCRNTADTKKDPIKPPPKTKKETSTKKKEDSPTKEGEGTSIGDDFMRLQGDKKSSGGSTTTTPSQKPLKTHSDSQKPSLNPEDTYLLPVYEALENFKNNADTEPTLTNNLAVLLGKFSKVFRRKKLSYTQRIESLNTALKKANSKHTIDRLTNQLFYHQHILAYFQLAEGGKTAVQGAETICKLYVDKLNQILSRIVNVDKVPLNKLLTHVTEQSKKTGDLSRSASSRLTAAFIREKIEVDSSPRLQNRVVESSQPANSDDYDLHVLEKGPLSESKWVHMPSKDE